MRSFEEIKKNTRTQIEQIVDNDGGWGYIYFQLNKKPALVIFSVGDGWYHVSISFNNRCCTWDEMCMTKEIFFKDDECVVQYHPTKQNYVNQHQHCLHLWKPQKLDMPMPPIYMV